MIYEPAEDSFLIQKEVKRLAKGAVLELGIGSGILAGTALKSTRVKSLIGVDIKNVCVEHCKQEIKDKRARFLQSDLFENVPKKKFDVIIFNPPYLPEQEGELWDLSANITGGKQGYEVIERFLANAADYLTDNGFILLLFSTITGKLTVESLIEQNLLEPEQLSKKAISFEQLHVYKIKRSTFLKQLERKGVKDINFFAKGHRGYIHTGKLRGKKIAIKSQRPNIDAKDTVDNEAKQLKRLKKHKIGPELLFSGKDYFAYKFVEGKFIIDYFNQKSTKRTDVLNILIQVFEQMYKLDKLGLNKEEMHHPVKHVVVGPKNKMTLLDFERCKPKQTTHNVTQFCQFVISGRLIRHLENHKLKISMLDMLKHSKRYAHRKTRDNFEAILALIK
ncbi:HemK2/MTQ2 family protein methyltransferase [Nanoarchaeota archaeon]